MSEAVSQNPSAGDVKPCEQNPIGLTKPLEHSKSTMEKIKVLLGAVGSRKIKPDDNIETTPYDWSHPKCFNNEELDKFNGFTKKLVAATAKNFSSLYSKDFEVEADSATQHFTDEFLRQPPAEKPNYYLAFGADQNDLCGLICIEAETALLWTAQLLGDSISKDELNRELLPLEKTLLMDIALLIVKAFSKCHKYCDFVAAEKLIKSKPIPISDADETKKICKIILNIKQADSKDDAKAINILIPCGILDSVVGKKPKSNNNASDANNSKAILAHLNNATVSATAQLVRMSLKFEEVMELSAGDVLVLDKKIDEPIDFIIEDKMFFKAKPAQAAGKYAVVITEPLCKP
ncbi:MAG: FliM/FliN family flagellar motor switch protein [Planctomycetes bacterium]|nr:FliM/FliN family flagellar motor switch protein [Planctomycetota bacterium]